MSNQKQPKDDRDWIDLLTDAYIIVLVAWAFALSFFVVSFCWGVPQPPLFDPPSLPSGW